MLVIQRSDGVYAMGMKASFILTGPLILCHRFFVIGQFGLLLRGEARGAAN
ncbi:MAG: hypothetical protein AAGE61_12030 [Pseudomonadota bacterium]